EIEDGSVSSFEDPAKYMVVVLLTEWLSSVLDYLLQSQKPDGSVGYFLRERRLLGVGDISNIRLGLTHLFVEAVEAWLDYRIAKGRSSGEPVSQPMPAA
ncbi:MAG: hypothetical protein AAFP15_19800, partial [Bacteroidota bacterium]